MLTKRISSYIITLASGGNDRKQRKNRKQTAVGEKYSRGRRGAPAKGVGRETGARVQIPLSPPYRISAIWSSGVVANMPPCHGGDREFDPRLDRHYRRCSSMVERDLAKVDTGVRFPSLAPLKTKPLKELFLFIII